MGIEVRKEERKKKGTGGWQISRRILYVCKKKKKSSLSLSCNFFVPGCTAEEVALNLQEGERKRKSSLFVRPAEFQPSKPTRKGRDSPFNHLILGFFLVLVLEK
jgi:hypothetical protein